MSLLCLVCCLDAAMILPPPACCVLFSQIHVELVIGSSLVATLAWRQKLSGPSPNAPETMFHALLVRANGTPLEALILPDVFVTLRRIASACLAYMT